MISRMVLVLVFMLSIPSLLFAQTMRDRMGQRDPFQPPDEFLEATQENREEALAPANLPAFHYRPNGGLYIFEDLENALGGGMDLVYGPVHDGMNFLLGAAFVQADLSQSYVDSIVEMNKPNHCVPPPFCGEEPPDVTNVTNVINITNNYYSISAPNPDILLMQLRAGMEHLFPYKNVVFGASVIFHYTTTSEDHLDVGDSYGANFGLSMLYPFAEKTSLRLGLDRSLSANANVYLNGVRQEDLSLDYTSIMVGIQRVF